MNQPPRQAGLTPARTGLAASLLVAAGLLWGARGFLTQPVYEAGDTAANSLLILDAKSLELLVGHYSRLGFHHPGPGVLYYLALGEVLLNDLLGVTPAPHNGQILAVALLTAAALGAVAGMVRSWAGSWPPAAVGLAAVLGWYVTRGVSLTDPWIPLLVVPVFLLFLVAVASLASGQVRHAWIVALTGGLLVHAHVAFTLQVGVLAVAAVAALAARTRAGPSALIALAPRAWAVAAAVVAAFVAPILANTLLNWPGEIPRYLAHSSDRASSATAAEAVRFTLEFWPAVPGLPLQVVAALLVLAAAASAAAAPRQLRQPLGALTATALLAEALFLAYARFGVDDLGQLYLGFFGWSISAALLLVVAVAVAARLPASRALPTAVGAAAALVVVLLAASPTLTVSTGFRTDVPQLLDATVRAAGRTPLLLDVGEGIQPFLDAPALLLQADREGVEACVTDQQLEVALTPQRICTPEELAAGRVVAFRPAGTSAQTTVRGYGDITVLP